MSRRRPVRPPRHRITRSPRAKREHRGVDQPRPAVHRDHGPVEVAAPAREASQTTSAATSSGSAARRAGTAALATAIGRVAVDPGGARELIHRRVGHRRPRPRRADRVRAHAERSEVDRDGLREHHHRGLRGAVGGAARPDPARRRRRDRDDRSAALDQRGQRRPRDEEGAVEVRAHHRAPALGRLFEHGARSARPRR